MGRTPTGSRRLAPCREHSPASNAGSIVAANAGRIVARRSRPPPLHDHRRDGREAAPTATPAFFDRIGAGRPFRSTRRRPCHSKRHPTPPVRMARERVTTGSTPFRRAEARSRRCRPREGSFRLGCEKSSRQGLGNGPKAWSPYRAAEEGPRVDRRGDFPIVTRGRVDTDIGRSVGPSSKYRK